MHTVLPRVPEPWLDYWAKMARLTATRSKDPSKQVGAVIVNQQERQIFGLGYNGPPSAFVDSTVNWEKPHKHMYVLHAEINALYNAIDKVGLPRLTNSTIITTLMPCANCLLNLIACKVSTCIYLSAVSSMLSRDEVTNIYHIAAAANFSLVEYKYAES